MGKLQPIVSPICLTDGYEPSLTLKTVMTTIKGMLEWLLPRLFLRLITVLAKESRFMFTCYYQSSTLNK